MLSILLNIIKIAFLLGFLIFIHEGGHFLVAKLCKIKVKEFAIGFGPIIWKKQGKETKYVLRLVPLGGFVNLLGEEETVDEEGSFSKAGTLKKIGILLAGGMVNIIFGLVVYFIVISAMTNIQAGLELTIDFAKTALVSVKDLFTGNVGVDQLTGPVGISEVVVQTKNVLQFVYILAVISFSLGVTNLLPIPPLDGGKILLVIIEKVTRKPIKEKVSVAIQMTGFFLIMGLAVLVTYNDVLRIF